MRTVDVRLLVRGSAHVPDLLEQLLSGALRVHAVVELVPDPRASADRGTATPSLPIHRHRHSESHYAVVRDWRGDVLPVDDRGGARS